MTIKPSSLACGIFALSSIAMVLAQGCGGSTDDGLPSTTDSGSEASTDDASPASDAASVDAAPPDAGDPFCDALNAKATRCGTGGPCTTAYCPQFEALYSAGGLLAEAQCLPLQACDNSPAPGADKDYKDCIATKSPPPDAAAQKLIADVCAACAPGVADCASGAFAAPDGGKRGFGTGVPQLSDSLIDEIDAKCVMSPADAGDGGPVQCAADFDKCITKVVRNRLTPAPAVCGDI